MSEQFTIDPLRTLEHIMEHPLPGDVVEIVERKDEGDFDSMLRVIAVAEDRVWCKEYGMVGHRIVTLISWRNRLKNVLSAKVVQTHQATV